MKRPVKPVADELRDHQQREDRNHARGRAEPDDSRRRQQQLKSAAEKLYAKVRQLTQLMYPMGHIGGQPAVETAIAQSGNRVIRQIAVGAATLAEMGWAW